MYRWLEVSGDISAAATALGGLLLVFLGAVSTSYGTFDATQKGAVRMRHLRRGILGLFGFLFALLAASLALVGKIRAEECLVAVSSYALGAAILLSAAAGIYSVIDLLE